MEAGRDRLTKFFLKDGMERSTPPPRPAGRYFDFFGATPESWIGKLWPRGRAWKNELSMATITDNFCNGWSGGLNFLDYRHGGSGGFIDPAGEVYSCWVKTKTPGGKLFARKL